MNSVGDRRQGDGWSPVPVDRRRMRNTAKMGRSGIDKRSTFQGARSMDSLQPSHRECNSKEDKLHFEKKALSLVFFE